MSLLFNQRDFTCHVTFKKTVTTSWFSLMSLATGPMEWSSSTVNQSRQASQDISLTLFYSFYFLFFWDSFCAQQQDEVTHYTSVVIVPGEGAVSEWTPVIPKGRQSLLPL